MLHQQFNRLVLRNSCAQIGLFHDLDTSLPRLPCKIAALVDGDAKQPGAQVIAIAKPHLRAHKLNDHILHDILRIRRAPRLAQRKPVHGSLMCRNCLVHELLTTELVM